MTGARQRPSAGCRLAAATSARGGRVALTGDPRRAGRTGGLMASADFPAPEEGFVLTHFIVAADVERSRDFYVGVLGGRVVLEGEPTIVKLANGWVIINVGGGPTDDKPEVVLEPPGDLNRVSAFLNIRVADIHAAYEEWRARGAEFLTPPKDHGADIGGGPGATGRPQPGQRLPEHPRRRHPRRLRGMEGAGGGVPDPAQGPRRRDPLLHARPRRPSDRGRPVDRCARPAVITTGVARLIARHADLGEGSRCWSGVDLVTVKRDGVSWSDPPCLEARVAHQSLREGLRPGDQGAVQVDLGGDAPGVILWPEQVG